MAWHSHEEMGRSVARLEQFIAAAQRALDGASVPEDVRILHAAITRARIGDVVLEDDEDPTNIRAFLERRRGKA